MSRIRVRQPQMRKYVLVVAFFLFSYSANLAPVSAQVQYGAPVPPLIPASDPMIQGPLVQGPTYGAPVQAANVPSFWQANPQMAQPGPPVYYGAPAGVVGGDVIGGELIQPIEGTEGIIEEIVAPDEEVAEELRPFNPVWYNPMSWIGPYWDGSVELGLTGSTGNVNAQTIRTGFDLSRETQRTNWDINFIYNQNEAEGVETLHNAILFSNWDFKMRNPKWTWFTKLGLEYDEFKEWNTRLSLNTGLGYLLIDTDLTQFRPRFGAGASREFGFNVVDDNGDFVLDANGEKDKFNGDWIPEAVFGFDFSRQISSRQSLTWTSDYYPAWEDFSDYRLINNVGWELVLDEVHNLSLKVSVIDRYDSTPSGADEKNDLNYSVLLLWSL